MSKTKNFQIQKKWIFLDNEEPKFQSIKINPEIVSILSNRGINTEIEALSFLNPDYSKLGDPFNIKDMDKAVETISLAVQEKKKITIYGDYDVDGITSTAVLVRFFNEIGVEVDFYIPSRQIEGYGLNREALDEIKKRGTELLITVDCGSTAIEEVDYANKIGLRVVITDHHSLRSENGEELIPKAEAVVNPRRKESLFNQELAGVGVAFYLVRALQAKLPEKLAEGMEKWFLDLVAMGTICDVVPLVGDNRILTHFGLQVIRKTKLIGICALANISGIVLKDISSFKVGFSLGPRLNAAGRIDHANKALELLITKDEQKATQIAKELNDLNIERQELTERIVNEAREAIKSKDGKQKIYLLANKDWPAGVVGIVASRLVEEFARPVLVMEDLGEELKGSARSISGFNIIEALSGCSEYLTHFGVMPMRQALS
jgi:single-stranded-DNA-specific exonuclease